jgi:hypothetical protein
MERVDFAQLCQEASVAPTEFAAYSLALGLAQIFVFNLIIVRTTMKSERDLCLFSIHKYSNLYTQ